MSDLATIKQELPKVLAFTNFTDGNLNDFGIKGPGPSSQTVDLDISLEGVKQK